MQHYIERLDPPKKGDRGQWVVLIDEVPHRLHGKTIKALGIKADTFIDETTYAAILALLYKRGLAYCYHLLAKKDYTKAEIMKKLKAYPEGVADQVIERLEDLKLVDDLAYAERYIRSHMHQKSQTYMRQKLAMKGITEKSIFQSVEGLEGATENALDKDLKRILKQANWSDLSRVEQQKAIQKLMRKGYTWSEIQSRVTLEDDYL